MKLQVIKENALALSIAIVIALCASFFINKATDWQANIV
jgi:hypothetical protein